MEPEVAQALEDDYQARFYSISIPALVIHGQWDESAPLPDAVDMFNKMETENKHLEIIPGAGHNDLMYVGFQQYFTAIRGFMARYAGLGPGPQVHGKRPIGDLRKVARGDHSHARGCASSSESPELMRKRRNIFRRMPPVLILAVSDTGRMRAGAAVLKFRPCH